MWVRRVCVLRVCVLRVCVVCVCCVCACCVFASCVCVACVRVACLREHFFLSTKGKKSFFDVLIYTPRSRARVCCVFAWVLSDLMRAS